MRLLLLRHGQTGSNVGGVLDTAVPGASLTELGQRQAAAVPAALEGRRIDAVYASVLLRAQQTAAPLAAERGLDVQVHDGIEEIHAGDLEGRNDRDSQRRYLGTAISWGDGNVEARIPGGEDGVEFFARYDTAVAGIAASHGIDETGGGDPDAAVLLVSHGAAIRVWVAGRADNVSPEFSVQHDLDNTGLIVVEGRPGAWTMEEWIGEPVGGTRLADARADDPTGEPLALPDDSLHLHPDVSPRP